MASPSTRPPGSWRSAGAGEILVSATVMDLVDGSDLDFDDAGVHELKGLRGARQLFRLVGGDPAA